MVASITTPEDAINVALVRIGYKRRLGSIWEGSPAAKLSLDVYAQTRDALLREFDFDFAVRNIVMTLLKQAPANGGYVPGVTPWNPAQNPTIPWLFSYAYPTDGLKIRAVKPEPLFFPDVDPQSYLFSVDNDGSQKIILCNVSPPAIVVYTGQITDLSIWDAGSIEALAAALARRLGPALAGLESIKAEIPDEAQAAAVAKAEEG